MPIEATPELVVGIGAAVVAIAALFIALVQALPALSKYLEARTRCSRKITGPFDLREGVLWATLSLAWNPRYRMPVITMPLLRYSVPVMGPGLVSTDFRPGNNFQKSSNSYLDDGKARISGQPPDRSEPINIQMTVLHIAGAVLWTPIGLVLSALTILFCLPCATFCCITVVSELVRDGDVARDLPCGAMSAADGLDAMTSPLWWVWKNAVHYEEAVKSTTGRWREARGLECAQWCQLLVNAQNVWWGHADIRWEWRLATFLPQDLLGITIESAMADVQLLASLIGMYFPNELSILAQTRCGDRITLSQHATLGRIAHFQSRRDNSQAHLTMEAPKHSSDWMRHCVDAHRIGLAARSGLWQRSADEKELAIALLARQRTYFDAQLNFPAVDSISTTSVTEFITRGNEIYEHSTGSTGWIPRNVIVAPGPLGSGPGRCSCLPCRADWARKNTIAITDCYKYYFAEDIPVYWPALHIGEGTDRRGSPHSAIRVIGPPCDLSNRCASYLSSEHGATEVQVEEKQICHNGCQISSCKCGKVARVLQVPGSQPSDAEYWAVAAINTNWLRKVSATKLREASQSLLDPASPQLPTNGTTGHASEIETITMVIAYTETTLVRVRDFIGAANIWDNCATPDLTDFTPLVLGS